MITFEELQAVIADSRPEFIEELAQKAKKIKEQYFGRTISLYAPLYLSNFCSSYCTYCGFHSHNKISRFKLTAQQMHKEMKFVSDQGIENILLLTGESYNITPLSYLQESVEIAKIYFPNISLEVHPMQEYEYRELFKIGVDGITVYQETYDQKRYKEVHISGIKSDFNFRYHTPERAAKGGIRNISMGILLGLAEDLTQDLFTLYSHLYNMERNHPGVEYSLSFPRLKTIKGKTFASCDINDITFIKIICLTRILFPRIGINLSTREDAKLRDNILELGITRMSAGSNTSVGGYVTKSGNEQNPQFDTHDKRTVKEIIDLLKTKNFDPVLTDWRRITNEILTND